MSEKGSTKKIGIKWKMFAILLVFIVAVVLVVWLFQVGLLNYFYRNTKFSELELTAEKMSSVAYDEDKLESVASECAEDYYSFIVIYKVENGVAKPMFETGNRAGSVMTFFSKGDLQKLYENTANSKDLCFSAVAFRDDADMRYFVFEEYNRAYFQTQVTKFASAVNTRLISTDGVYYFIIQTAELSPVNAVVRTLNKQFLWIGSVLVIIALVLALIISKLITKPIIEMNSAAQSLAHGRYDIEFSGKAYREICELSDTLNYAATELSKNDDLQRELIANVSHDLRTPLAMIKGYGEVMRDIPGENTPENVQVIIDETERLTGLVNDMLDMSKLQAGTRKPEITLFSLTDVVRDTMTRYEKLIKQDGYKIEFVADENVWVYADSVMLLQVVYNLINNAINYSGDDKRVVVTQSVSDSKVRLSVRDTGSGIAAEDIPLIWDRYYKVDKTHKRAAVGTGLGLSIVKEILELHGAKFGVNSTLGEGSTFWFELDIAEIPSEN